MATREERDEFSLMIMSRAEVLETDHMDAMITYCEEVNLEVESAASLVNDVLKAKLEEEAMDLGFIPRMGRLPI